MHLTWNLQLSRGRKVALLMLFASGVACIIIATLRAAQVTANTIRTNATMDGTLANIPSAVIIGLCPSFAILMRATRQRTKKTSYNAAGYVKQNGQKFQLQTIGNKSVQTKGNRTFWTEVSSSQEELAGRRDTISVSTTIQHDMASFKSTKQGQDVGELASRL
ncbi:hypothetical protein EK21DRAFT_100358 [Setomelanomma holmii]|uniref:Uncharacterized protein n=1 Tax=Setomelanomma holmii TaxID=210430 RepID=A0A9P4H9C2_9PLEO|nr:hypothetical protein EK21DRAFT_100358 [Setomelanomma holmii]